MNPNLNKRLHRRSLLFFAVLLFLLSFVSAWYFRAQPSVNYQQKLLQRYVDRQIRDARTLLRDSSLMRKLVQKSETLDEFREVEEKGYGVFLFAETISENQALLFWNNQKILPPRADFNLPNGTYFQKLANGSYVMIKERLSFSGMSNNVVAYLLIPVQNRYFLETDYLLTRFAHDADASKKISLSEEVTDYPIRSDNGKPLFHIRRVAHTSLATTDTLTLVLRIVGLIFLLSFIHINGEALVRRSRARSGIVFVAAALVLLRVLLYGLSNFFSFRQLALFDPAIYATNAINPSLGDLLINSVFVCWLVLFTWYNTPPVFRLPAFLAGKNRWIGGVLALFVLILVTFGLADVVSGLVLSSKISFNVTDFFGLDIYTVIGLIILALLSLSYYYFSRMIFRVIFTVFRDRYHIVYFVLMAIGLAYLTIYSGHESVLFYLPVLIWLLIYTFIVSQEQFIVNALRMTIAGVLFWIFIFSVSLSTLILFANRESELRMRKLMAEKEEQLADPSSDRTINIAIGVLDNRYLVYNWNRFFQPEANQDLRDSIITRSFGNYNRQYDSKIYVFDSLNRPVNNEDARSFAELNTIYTVQGKPTIVPDLRYYDISYDRFTYITQREVRGIDSVRLGTFFVISTPRQRGGNDALYPQLFRQVNRRDAEASPLYYTASYSNRLLISASAKYPFQTELSEDQLPKTEYERRNNAEYDELWYKAGRNKIIVIARKRDTLIASITLFSYLFCAFLFMVGLLNGLSWVLRVLQGRASAYILGQLSIRSQIHGTVIFISVLSFLIIGAATISFFIARYNRNNVDKLSVTSDVMVRELGKRLADTSSYRPGLTDSLSQANLQQLVNEVADIHTADVNVYDLTGNLQVSSEDKVYKQGVLSTQMHPRAFYHLSRLREVQYVQKEQLSSLTYQSIYQAVRDRQGRVIYYLNIPYFSSQIDLKQEISNFLVTIINLNAFIFLIAGIIALFITNKITRTFSVIGEKMRAITLGRTNEEIEWTRNDEIGDLVKQYNKMVHQLEASADALARSEREGAWREMARQVAHEIKNPLTPMKLSIQYLQRAIENNSGNVKELTASVANTLIEQIDHLSKIAADFSQFANIGNRKIELVDLHQVIGILVDLYSSNPKVEIEWQHPPGSVVMKADKTHMNRVFTNLLANAVDACAGNEVCAIRIEEEQEDHRILIRITDNGEGIPAEMRSKIFTPNFTTKTSGTGLGLAMCKNIVEQSGGNIWFETEEGRGTTFFVELPVIG